MNVNEYSHPAFLNNLSAELKEDILIFVNTGESSTLLDKVLMGNERLRDLVDKLTDRELEKYGED
jgi:hypothetical protein